MDSGRPISLAGRDRNHPGEAPAKPPAPILYGDGLRALARQGFSVMSGMTCLLLLLAVSAGWWLRATDGPAPAIRFELKPIAFQLEHGEAVARHVPATMAGGLAVFDYNCDGRPDIFFTTGANLATLKKDDPKYRNRLFRNDGHGVFTDVTESAGLAGTGFDSGVAVGDYDNDGYPDLFVAGVHRNTLYHNNGDGQLYLAVSKQCGLPDAEHGVAPPSRWLRNLNPGWIDGLRALRFPGRWVLSSVWSPFFQPPSMRLWGSAPVGHRPIAHRLPSKRRHVRETRVPWRFAAVPQQLAPPSETATGSCLPRLESGCDTDRGGPWGCRRKRSPPYHTESCDRIASPGAWVGRGPTRRRVGGRERGLPEGRPCRYLTAYTTVRSSSENRTQIETAH
jgi:hypothetical protein